MRIRVRPDAEVRPVVMVGEFDGFHLGHRQLVQRARQVADRTGRPLVAVVLDDRGAAEVLTDIDGRCRALVQAGVDHAAVASVDADDLSIGTHLVDQIVTGLQPHLVVMACLPDDRGTARFPAVRDALRRRHVELVELPRWCNPDGTPVTSSAIRAALRDGDIVRANDWLGRSFHLAGLVVHGSGLGRTIGFPTANLALRPTLLVPAHGVYAAEVELADGTRHAGAVNIGIRPTVASDGQRLVEAHLLDFDGDLYDQTISLAFRRWLRHEQRFDSLDALTAQLAIDVEQTRLLLGNA